MNSDVMPVGNLTMEQVQTVMQACAAAPPARNKRPWRRTCTTTALELRAVLPMATSFAGPGATDPGRSADTSTEPDPRETMLACGAALLNVRTTIRRLGVHPAVRLIPDVDEPELLAVVHPQAGQPPTAADVALAEAIAQRRTSPPLTVGIPMPMVNRLRQAARVEQTWLAILPPEELRAVQLGYLDTEADRAAGAGGQPDGRASEARPDLMVAVIGSFHDTPLAWLQSGQGMQRVLLTAGAAGLTTSLLSHVIRAAPARKQLRRLIGGGVWPQAVLSLTSPTASAPARAGGTQHTNVQRRVNH